MFVRCESPLVDIEELFKRKRLSNKALCYCASFPHVLMVLSLFPLTHFPLMQEKCCWQSSRTPGEEDKELVVPILVGFVVS